MHSCIPGIDLLIILMQISVVSDVSLLGVITICMPLYLLDKIAFFKDLPSGMFQNPSRNLHTKIKKQTRSNGGTNVLKGGWCIIVCDGAIEYGVLVFGRARNTRASLHDACVLVRTVSPILFMCSPTCQLVSLLLCRARLLRGLVEHQGRIATPIHSCVSLFHDCAELGTGK